MANEPVKEKKSSALETLLREDFRNLTAVEDIRSDPFKYGSENKQIADSVYDNTMGSELMGKYKNEIYQGKKEKYKSKGVTGDPVVPDAEVVYAVREQIEQAMLMANLGELEKVINKITDKIDFKVPEKLKKISYTQITKELQERKAISAKGEVDLNKLSEDKKNALEMYKVLSQFYTQANVKSLIDGVVYDSINKVGKDIEEKYNPKKKEEAKVVQMNPNSEKASELEQAA